MKIRNIVGLNTFEGYLFPDSLMFPHWKTAFLKTPLTKKSIEIRQCKTYFLILRIANFYDSRFLQFLILLLSFISVRIFRTTEKRYFYLNVRDDF